MRTRARKPDAKQILVYGASGHCKIVCATIEAMGKFQVVALLDDDPAKYGTVVFGYPVAGGREQLARLVNSGVTQASIAVGDNRQRVELGEMLAGYGFEFPAIVHPTAICLRGSTIGAGTFLGPSAWVGGDAVIGEHTIINLGSVVAHDCRIDYGAQLTPHVVLGGGVQIGEMAFIGLNATILPQTKIGARTIVGAGAVVTQDLPDDVTAIGVPARIIKHNDLA
jgi:sugar O-acyltransferase (sialic acid O-acetyltransferase NeuD family)